MIMTNHRLARAARAATVVAALGLAACQSNNPPPLTPLPGVSNGTSANIQNRAPDSEARKRARLRMELGVTYYQDGKFSVALDELKQALALDPTFADAIGVLALVYMELGEKDLAEQSFQKALSLQPNDSDINVNYGWFLCRNGHEAQSIPYFLAATKNPLYTQPALAYQNAGLCAEHGGDPANAEGYFLKSFSIDPSGPVASYSLARIYFARKDLERARFYVGRVNKTPAATSDSLWLGIKIEHALANAPEESSLATQLQRAFPNSLEAQLLSRRAYNE